LGLKSAVVDITDNKTVEKLFENYPNIRCVVDSVPPPSDFESYSENLKLLAKQVQYSIYLSTTGVYGRVNGEVVDEQTSLNPNHARATARVRAEVAHQNTFEKSTILRLPAIYGPGRGIGNAIKSGRYKIIGKGQRFTNRIHVEDICLTIKTLIDCYFSSKFCPPILCVSDGAPIKQIDIVNFCCTRFGFNLPESVPEQIANQQLDPTMLSNQRISNALLKSFLGRELKYPTYEHGADTEFAEYCK
jgi:nucleoside-diphosphate-sugar epimerase